MKHCNSCGKCCIKYGNGDLSASQTDLEGWSIFNPHIDDHVRNSRIWFDPITGKALELCPWLRKSSEGERVRYSCDIYWDRPEDCRHYPTSIAEMVADDCEMIEVKDLSDLKKAQRVLDALMSDSRPALDA